MSAKNIIIKPIPRSLADPIVLKYHYSGKIVNNSQLCFGIYYKGKLLGAMTYGPPTDKSKILPLVSGTGWNGMFELNRMAFSDLLPKFSESRAISQSIKWIKKNAPHIKWILSFADGTQCGHGTIYQASNFKLIDIKKNSCMHKLPNGDIQHTLNFGATRTGKYANEMKKHGITNKNEYLNKFHKGWEILGGFMFKYIYFIDRNFEKNLTCKYIPFNRIRRLKIGMYKGEKIIY